MHHVQRPNAVPRKLVRRPVAVSSKPNGEAIQALLKSLDAGSPPTATISRRIDQPNAATTPVPTGDHPTVKEAERSDHLEGDKLIIALRYTKTIGPLNADGAKLTVTTVRSGKKQKIEYFLTGSQVLELLVNLARSISPDGELCRAIDRFAVKDPRPE